MWITSFCFKPLALGVNGVSSLPVFILLVGMGGFQPGPGSAHLGVGVGQSVEMDLSWACLVQRCSYHVVFELLKGS